MDFFSCFVCFLECPNFNMTRASRYVDIFQLYDTEIANINWALSSSTTEVTLTCLFCHTLQGRRNRGQWVTIDIQYFGRSSSINLFHQNAFYFFVFPPPLDFQNFRRHCFKSLFHYGLHGRGSKSLVALFTSPRSFC